MAIEDFGRQLIQSGDLDPIYTALVAAERSGDFDVPQLCRWMVAYWCYYNAGVASFMSEKTGPDFWNWMMVAAINEQETPVGGRWARGHERRHFRAKNATESVAALCDRYRDNPENMVLYIGARWDEGDRLPFKVVSARAQEHRGFGPWIGFKCADMIDRVMEVPVDFDQAAVFMFKDPEKAAMMLWEQREAHKYPEGAKPKREAILSGVTEYLIKQFADLTAPPLGDRPINIQEVETVLCKWKSHMNGHYPLYNDIREINEGLKPWVNFSPAAAKFYRHMPKEPQS
ncbi:hypothetical protein [Bordetella phage CN1]|uniref:Amino acid:DNA transferase domain-containing protein n=1 Tax=Bordetella phage CN1 TaxID=1916123 RepID=A0A2D0W9N9_9CAUD|nr:hypothetical protein HOS29_gp09 [Bordetella phage CN1]APL99388.1 hypothetical protein [Bordetella phage CN1]